MIKKQDRRNKNSDIEENKENILSIGENKKYILKWAMSSHSIKENYSAHDDLLQ